MSNKHISTLNPEKNPFCLGYSVSLNSPVKFSEKELTWLHVLLRFPVFGVKYTPCTF